jgi:hypothetical protein
MTAIGRPRATRQAASVVLIACAVMAGCKPDTQPSDVAIRAIKVPAAPFRAGEHLQATVSLEATVDKPDYAVELLMFRHTGNDEEVVGVQVAVAVLAVKQGSADYAVEISVPADMMPASYELWGHEYSRTDFVNAGGVYVIEAAPTSPQLDIQRTETSQAALLVDAASTVDPAAPTTYRPMPLSAVVQIVSRYAGASNVPITASLDWNGTSIPLWLWDSQGARWVEKLLVPALALETAKSVLVQVAMLEADAQRIRPDVSNGPVHTNIVLAVNADHSVAETPCSASSSPPAGCRHTADVATVVYAAPPSASLRRGLAVADSPPQTLPLRYEKSWSEFAGDADIGAGADLSGWAELSAMGYSAQLIGGLPMKLVGHSFDFARATAEAQISPLQAHAAIRVDVVGIHVYDKSYDQTAIDVNFSDEFPSARNQIAYEWLFAIGPVPVTVMLGASGSYGLQGRLYGASSPSTNQAEIVLTGGATGDISAFAAAMVGAEYGAGVACDLNLVKVALMSTTQGQLTVTMTQGGFADYITGSLSEKLTCQVNLLSGGLAVFVRYPWVKMCKKFGIPYPCGFTTKEKEKGICSWDGFVIGPYDLLYESSPTWTINLCLPTLYCAGHCGTLFNGCHDVSCGECPTGTTCGGGGVPNVCGCATSASCAGKCGIVPDGCGGTMDCGGCTAPQTCGGGGVPNVCGCTPTATCTGKCGSIPDGCGGTVSCGTCPAPQTCGGGGVPNVCGCTPTATCTGRCGSIPDGCGGTVPCGECAAGETCNSSGACVPRCMDGIKNGQETDVDCGGPTCVQCLLGQACLATSDCGPQAASGQNVECATNVCSCMSGWGNCDSNRSNACETDLRINVSHCGGCGIACPARANAVTSCAGGTCGFTCNAGYGNCDASATNGCETNLSTSAANCGACGHACASSQRCVASQCVAPDLPDLVPTMTHSPASPGLYEQVTVTVVVHNFGNAAAGASTMTVSRNDGTPSPRSVPALNPGETYSVALTPDVFPVPGTRTYTVVVDSAGVIAESNESNNTATHSITVSQ